MMQPVEGRQTWRSTWAWRAARVCVRLTLVVAMAVAGVTCSPPGTRLDALMARGDLRVATLNRATTYFENENGEPAGFDYDLLVMLAADLGLQLDLQVYPHEADALDAVLRGEADLAATGSVATRQRRAQWQYAPELRRVTPQVVYRRGTRRPRRIDDVNDTLRVVADSAIEDLLERTATRHPELAWESVEGADDDTLVYEVAEGQHRLAVVSSDIVSISRRFYPKLAVAFDLGDPMPVSWALRRGTDGSLYNRVAQFVVQMRDSRELDRIRDRYFGQLGRLNYVGSREFSRDVTRVLPRYRPTFEEAARLTGLDWRLLAAVGYQESHWNPKAKSPTGVRGLMMLTRDTAKYLGVADRTDARQSIMGGARYLRDQIDRLPDSIGEPDRTWMALAAYNLGRGHLLDARRLAASQGGDPDRWVDVRAVLPLLTQAQWHTQTRHGYARGHEAVTYVGNIRTYYDILNWVTGGEVEVPPATREPEEQRPPPPETDPGERALDLESPIL